MTDFEVVFVSAAVGGVDDALRVRGADPVGCGAARAVGPEAAAIGAVGGRAGGGWVAAGPGVWGPAGAGAPAGVPGGPKGRP